MPGYSTLGDLYLRGTKNGPVSDYRRQLDLETGVARVTYTMNGVHYTREVFASMPDRSDCRAADRGQKGRDQLPREHGPASGLQRARRADKTRSFCAKGPEHKEQIRFAGEALVLPTGGSVHAEGSEIVVADADSVTILIAAATDFKGGPFAGGDPEAQCERALAQARKHSAAADSRAAGGGLSAGLPRHGFASGRRARCQRRPAHR